MFEEPVRFVMDVVQRNSSVLDFLYGNYTFVNGVLARHYGMPEPPGETWARVDEAQKYARGGLLPMSVFLTKNAPGLRTSPVRDVCDPPEKHRSSQTALPAMLAPASSSLVTTVASRAGT